MSKATANLQYIDRSLFIRNYWAYYLTLEARVIQASNFVQIHKDNYDAFSNEFATLQYSIGAELDTFFKVYCGYQAADKTNIADYSEQILNGRYNDIVNQEIELREYDLTIQPYKDWNTTNAKESLLWWRAYDNVKHSRFDNMKDASLKNVLNLLGALFILEMKYLKELADLSREMDCPDSGSRLFTMKNWETRCHTFEEASFEAF